MKNTIDMSWVDNRVDYSTYKINNRILYNWSEEELMNLIGLLPENKIDSLQVFVNGSWISIEEVLWESIYPTFDKGSN